MTIKLNETRHLLKTVHEDLAPYQDVLGVQDVDKTIMDLAIEGLKGF